MEQNPLNQKNEKPPIYDGKGRVIDSDIAQEGAEAENKYHKKTLGFFRPSKEKIKQGNFIAGLIMEKGEEIKSKDMPSIVQKEVKKYQKEIKDKHDLPDFSIDKIIKADIGGGIVRYHVFYTAGDSTFSLMQDIPSVKSSNLYDEEAYITIDVKDKSIIQSKIEEL